ncbi:hypothetical protein GCM10009736_79790 [Actinomadura bangladeshensis]|nr:DUF3556 domain-containing protein [Actinomadura bangladeshensis]
MVNGGVRRHWPDSMGFLQPDFPQFDRAEWQGGTRIERMRPLIRHLCEVGFGTPDVVYLLYTVKIGLYVLGAMGFALATEGIDGFTSVGQWWAAPVVFEKLVLWSMLFEVLGLGCGFGPLNSRILPPLGSFLYWLRPGTIRLPPWPGRVPFTRGDARTPLDVLLYGCCWPRCCSRCCRTPPPTAFYRTGSRPWSWPCSESWGCVTAPCSWPPVRRCTRRSPCPSCSPGSTRSSVPS